VEAQGNHALPVPHSGRREGILLASEENPPDPPLEIHGARSLKNVTTLLEENWTAFCGVCSLLVPFPAPP